MFFLLLGRGACFFLLFGRESFFLLFGPGACVYFSLFGRGTAVYSLTKQQQKEHVFPNLRGCGGS